MEIKIIGDRVLVEVEKKEEKTSSGLLLPKAQEIGDILTGKVCAVGMPMEGDKYTWNEVKVGDRIMFQYGTGVILEGKSYLLVNGSDILVIL